MRFLRIIVPVLNEGLGLGPRLRALRPLRERGAELVVVDGGSTDETWAVASAHADRVLLAPQGRASQLNAGARGAEAQVLLFLHADTALPPQADRLIASALEPGHRWGRFDVRIDAAHPLLRLAERLMNLRSRATGIATGDQAIFVLREVFERLGGFADVALMEDVEFTRRLKRICGRPACISRPAVTSGRRWKSAGVLRTILLMWRLRLAYFLGADPVALADRYGYTRRPPAAAAAVAILAKAPTPGLAKTRLAPALGSSGAARVQRCFTRDTVQLAQAAALGPVTLWCAPQATHRFFRALQRRTGVGLSPQCTGDLGQRMTDVMAQHFARHPGLPLLIVGTDCPSLAPGHLLQAARALASHDAVLIGAEDGGYVLIGMRRPLATVFENIAWSTAAVASQTRERLRAAGAGWIELAPLWDVDQPADWDRLQRLRAVSEQQDGCVSAA